MIFKNVLDYSPYPSHNLDTSKWNDVMPKKVELQDIITTQKNIDLETLLNEDSTFYGDLFAHIIQWRDDLYLESGIHRTLRAALSQQNFIHARVLTISDTGEPILAPHERIP